MLSEIVRHVFRKRRSTNFKLATWYTEEVTSTMTFNVKGQGRKVTWCIWQVLAHTSRKKRPRNTKIGRKVAHPTGNNTHQFQWQRSKVKVSRSTNAKTGSASYRPNGKAYELLTWYTDGERRPVSPTSAVSSKVKGQGRKVTWFVWQASAYK